MKEDEIFNAPALPKLPKLSGGQIMRRRFQNAGPHDKIAYGLAVNYVSLVDQAARSYELARESMLRFTSTHDALAWGAVESGRFQFELCVQAIHRAVLMGKAIVRYKNTPIGLRNCISAGSNILPKRLIVPFRNLRDASQHLDEKLWNGEIEDGQAVSLMPCPDSLELGGCSVKYDDLVTAITTLHQFAVQVAKFREEPDS